MTAAPSSLPLMQQIAAQHERISDKARALADAGYSISQIAKTLNRSYQQIRQIVKDYEARKARESTTEGPAPASKHGRAPAPEQARPAPEHELPSAAGSAAFFRLIVEDDGSIRLPRHILEAFGALSGDVLTGLAGGGELVLRSPEASVLRAQELVRTLIPGDDSLADSLIADRRREAQEEQHDG